MGLPVIRYHCFEFQRRICRFRSLHKCAAASFFVLPPCLRLLRLLLFRCLRKTPLPPPVPSNAPYKNTSLPVEKRVADLLSRMTLEEKATMLSGSGWMESAPIERLGIPAIKMADGPMGVRSWRAVRQSRTPLPIR